jgi:hypothetical protein
VSGPAGVRPVAKAIAQPAGPATARPSPLRSRGPTACRARKRSSAADALAAVWGGLLRAIKKVRASRGGGKPCD